MTGQYVTLLELDKQIAIVRDNIRQITEQATRALMMSGAHAIALQKLQHWCDEASLVHWESSSIELPGWSEAEEKLRASGRTSRVRHPSPAHARGETLPAD